MSDEDNISRRGGGEKKQGMESASKVTRKSKRIADRMHRLEGSVMDTILAPSAGSYNGTTRARISQVSASSDVEEPLAYGASSSSTMSKF